jgi:hypothetical protein
MCIGQAMKKNLFVARTNRGTWKVCMNFRSHRAKRASYLIAAYTLMIVAGCRDAHEQEVAPVRGAVWLSGKVIRGGSVMFMPSSGRGAVGPIDSEGNFVLTTYQPGDGAIVGRHKVAVFPVGAVGESDDIPANFVDIPVEYRNPHSSGIEVEVKPGEENVLEINLGSG